ncbi:glycine zipper 2TM domain-containing protein [Sphingomonas soli]|uniref:glycine zipper 2TM domain-containing protein n=1 Tax=Sphingomonas soli TaxID=266127 RepID=UPI00082D55EF|nr:glycine zipper 2TM domain-containing protein [Sphingomonas soli]
MKKLFAAALTASVALAGFSATPAAAQDRYGYSQYDSRGYQRDYRRYDNYDRRYDDRGYRNHRRAPQRCGSGTTGAIVGGVLGALLGGEIGRGSGYYDQRSGTGTIVGAGAGALLGREIDRGNCNNSRRGYRR